MTLEHRRLGRTGKEVSALGLGAFQVIPHFGVSEDEAARIFALAASSGIDYVDTAPMYENSELLVGRALQANSGWAPTLSTKVGYFPEELGESRYRDPKVIRDSLLRSLTRFDRERIDVLMVHEPEWKEWGLEPDGRSVVTDTLRGLRDEGLIGAIGLGGWNTTQVAGFLDGGLFDVVLVAGAFTLLSQTLRDELLPAAARQDVGVTVGGAFGQGIPWLLTPDRAAVEAMLRAGEVVSPNPLYTFTVRDAEKLIDLYDLSDETGMPLTEMTIRYVLSEPGIHTHIAGAREAAHLKANLDAFAKGPLDAATIARIEA